MPFNKRLQNFEVVLAEYFVAFFKGHELFNCNKSTNGYHLA